MNLNNPNNFNNKQIIIKKINLPLFCSGNLTDEKLSALHPKVYLPIKEKKIINCPYCGLQYVLVE